MLRIAVCDDDEQELRAVATLLRQYRLEGGKNIEYEAYQSPLELVASMQKGAHFDVLLLDIVMPGENGIEAAWEIRELDSDVRIIFLTSSPEFALQSYSVGAYFYQLKPVSKEALFLLLGQIDEEVEKAQADSLVLKCKTGISRISLEKLEYCEVIGKTIFFHLSSGRVLESTASMEKISERLSASMSFLRVHRSFTVNLDYVLNISYHAITMVSLAEIPIPRGKYTEIKDAFLARAFEKGWESS